MNRVVSNIGAALFFVSYSFYLRVGYSESEHDDKQGRNAYIGSNRNKNKAVWI